MSLGPEQLEELHEKFWKAIVINIPKTVLTLATGTGAIEDDIVRAVEIMRKDREAANEFFQKLTRITGKHTYADVLTEIASMEETDYQRRNPQ